MTLAALATLAGTGSMFIASDASAQLPAARPWLGIAMEPDPQVPGVRLGHVVRGSPADKAGLREGDHVLRVAGTPVAHGADVVQAVSAFAIGDTV